MITFTTVTTIDDTEFDALFWASLPSLDGGTYPWKLHGTLTDLEKRDHLRARFNAMLTDGLVWRVADDDGVLMLNAGTQNGASAKWSLSLVKPDAADSKAWLYGADYRNARNAYWTSLGVTSFVLETAGANTAVYNHVLAVEAANALGVPMSYSSAVVTPDYTAVEFTIG